MMHGQKNIKSEYVDCVWNVMAHTQKPGFVFRRNGRVHLNLRGRQSSRLLAAEVCASAVVMLDTPCSEVVWRVLATHSIRQFPLHFSSRASPCVITFQLDSNSYRVSPAAVVARTRLSITLYLHCLSCWQEVWHCVVILCYGISPSDLVHNTACPFMALPSAVALWHRHPVCDGTSRDSCGAQWHLQNSHNV